MRSMLSALFLALFASALLAGTLTHYSRDVEDLRTRLDDSAARLARARAELDSFREESLKRLHLMDAGVARTRTELHERTAPRDVEALYQDVLAPSVQVNARGGVGGGTILSSRPEGTYIITAFHVIHKVVKRDAPGLIEVRLYDARGALTDTLEADLVAHDETKDLSLLRLRTDQVFPHVARLASRATIRTIKVFDPVYAIGCPLGHDPLPTMGEIATLHKEVNGERFWMMNAPTIFGNSGGGIFHRDTRELIGVSVMVCTYDGVVSTPVPHLGIFVALDSVYDWLDELDYGFVYDPAAESQK